MKQPASDRSAKTHPGFIRTILLTTLIAGTLDISAAFIQFAIRTGQQPAILLRYIATAVFGQSAMSGSMLMAGAGLFFHYLVVSLFVVFYFGLYPKVSLLRNNKVVAGIAYAAFAWLVMTFIVVPLSLAKQGAFNPVQALVAVLILVFCIGLPISLMANKYYLYQK